MFVTYGLSLLHRVDTTFFFVCGGIKLARFPAPFLPLSVFHWTKSASFTSKRSPLCPPLAIQLVIVFTCTPQYKDTCFFSLYRFIFFFSLSITTIMLGVFYD